MASSNQAAGTRTQARNNTQAIVVTAMCIALTYILQQLLISVYRLHQTVD